jgi:23S rRNA (adenine2030-N6)-methyltransferase
MLSYQHAYHAGGPADLHKHIALAGLLSRLARKPRAIAYAETHAGRGLYDLAAPEAAKTGEAAAGILRLAPDPATPFGRVLAETRAMHGPSAYPGSPLLARMLLRPQDRHTLMELHPAEHEALHGGMSDAGVAVHRRDGFEGLLALAPLAPRRGLVFVDPSWEVKEDYARAVRFVRALAEKWPEASVLVWYPLLPAERHRTLVDGLALLSPFRHEVAFDRPGFGATGSGLLLVNPPFDAAAAFAATLAEGAPVLRSLVPHRPR